MRCSWFGCLLEMTPAVLCFSLAGFHTLPPCPGERWSYRALEVSVVHWRRRISFFGRKKQVLDQIRCISLSQCDGAFFCLVKLTLQHSHHWKKWCCRFAAHSISELLQLWGHVKSKLFLLYWKANGEKFVVTSGSRFLDLLVLPLRDRCIYCLVSHFWVGLISSDN